MSILCDLNEEYFFNPLTSCVCWLKSTTVNSPFKDIARLLLFKGVSVFLSFAWVFVFVAFTLNSLFHERTPNYRLMTSKETSLGSNKTTPRRTEKAKRTKRRETEVLKEKAKAEERAKAGRDQGRVNMKRRAFRRKASLACPQQRPVMDFFSPQRCLTWRKPWKRPSLPMSLEMTLTKLSWRCPHSCPTIQLKPPLRCPVHYVKRRLLRR